MVEYPFKEIGTFNNWHKEKLKRKVDITDAFSIIGKFELQQTMEIQYPRPKISCASSIHYQLLNEKQNKYNYRQQSKKIAWTSAKFIDILDLSKTEFDSEKRIRDNYEL